MNLLVKLAFRIALCILRMFSHCVNTYIIERGFIIALNRLLKVMRWCDSQCLECSKIRWWKSLHHIWFIEYSINYDTNWINRILTLTIIEFNFKIFHLLRHQRQNITANTTTPRLTLLISYTKNVSSVHKIMFVTA